MHTSAKFPNKREINSGSVNKEKKREKFLLRLATGAFPLKIHFSRTKRKGNVNISFRNYIKVNRCIKGGERTNPNHFLTKDSVRKHVAFNNPKIFDKRFRKSCYTYFA